MVQFAIEFSRGTPWRVINYIQLTFEWNLSAPRALHRSGKMCVPPLESPKRDCSRRSYYGTYLPQPLPRAAAVNE